MSHFTVWRGPWSQTDARCPRIMGLSLCTCYLITSHFDKWSNLRGFYIQIYERSVMTDTTRMWLDGGSWVSVIKIMNILRMIMAFIQQLTAHVCCQKSFFYIYDRGNKHKTSTNQAINSQGWHGNQSSTWKAMHHLEGSWPSLLQLHVQKRIKKKEYLITYANTSA